MCDEMETSVAELAYLAGQQRAIRSQMAPDDHGSRRESRVIEWALLKMAVSITERLPDNSETLSK